MRIRNDILAASAAAVLLGASTVSPAAGASATPIHKLTKTNASAAALKDATAAATISGGDKVTVTDCRKYGKTRFKCAVTVIPENSASRCHWTDTISLVKGKPSVKYSAASCTN
jgi:hypothetical protein